MKKHPKNTPSESEFKNAPLAKVMRDMGFTLSKTGNSYAVSGGVSAAHRYSSEFEALIKPHTVTNDDDDAKPAKTLMGTENVEFCGGSYRDLVASFSGRVDMGAFMRERARFADSGLEQKIRTRIADLFPRRKRQMSEHDGEWSFDRRWEVTPFQATQRVPSPGRTIDISCHMAVTCAVRAEEIARFGAVCWAICDLIESAGVSARIEMLCDVSRLGACNVDGKVRIEAKKAGEYVAPSLLAGMFTPLFYRRTMHSLEGIIPNLERAKNRCGLATPNQAPARVAYADGALTLAPSVIYAPDDEIEREILAAIGAEQRKAAA